MKKTDNSKYAELGMQPMMDTYLACARPCFPSMGGSCHFKLGVAAPSCNQSPLEVEAGGSGSPSALQCFLSQPGLYETLPQTNGQREIRETNLQQNKRLI